MLVIVTTSFGLEFQSSSAGKVNSTGNSCQPKTLETLNLSSDAGELFYEPRQGEVSIESDSLRSVRLPLHSQTRRISPNGLYIAGEDINDGDINFATVAVLDHSDKKIYSGARVNGNILDIRWLGNERLLSFVQLYSGSADVAYFIIDPFNKEYIYVEPPRTPPFYFDSPDKVVPIGGSPIGTYIFTYDSRYLFTGLQPVLDFETGQSLTLQNLRRGISSLNSHRLISADHETYRNKGVYPVYIYDFDTDTITQPITFTPESILAGEYENSWSPDETLWGYALYYPMEDLTSFRRVELLELESGKIRSTCFGLFYTIEGSGDLQYTDGGYSPQFAWSRDSRYLALQAVLEGQDMEESLGVYIYDTQTEDIYEVYRGRADIVGWMANP